MTGKERRAARVFGSDGRALVVPIDHAVTNGPIAGIADPSTTITNLLEGGADAMLMHRGLVAAGVWPAKVDAALIVHLSGGTEMSGRPELKTMVCDVEEALRLGADMVSIHVSLGTGSDLDALADLGRVSSACSKWGMPLLAMVYGYGDAASKRSCIPHAARIAAELGADCVKVNHPGDPELLRRLVEGCFRPVLIAGGERVSDSFRVLRGVEEALAAGAAGVCIGRNAYQHDTPSEFVRALRAVIHEGQTAAEAFERLPSTRRRGAAPDRPVEASLV